MKFGILGALKEEIELILTTMTAIKNIEHGNNTFYCGTIDQHSVVLVSSGMGKVAAASTATSLISYFNVDEIIVTGLAGAISATLNIGDIVISDTLYFHDMNAQPLYPKHEIPGTHISSFNADSVLISTAKTTAIRFLENIHDAIEQHTLAEFNITNTPQCHIGTIATGDQFIHCKEHAQKIINDRPDTLALEMEGAAVAQVCYNHKIPFVIIRIIADLADHNAEHNFTKFIHLLAKEYSKHIVTDMLANTRNSAHAH